MATDMAPDQQQLELPTGASSSSSCPRLRVLDTTLVRPLSLPETSLPLTFFDIMWLHSPPVERLFFYRLAPDADVAAVISKLKYSLHQAVQAFYPLSGRLRLAPGTSNRYELYYRPGDGVTFTVAECDDDDVGAIEMTSSPLTPGRFPRSPGSCRRCRRAAGCSLCRPRCCPRAAASPSGIGVTVHHAACDGSGSTHFLHTWAAACCGAEAPPPPPVIDRTLLSDPRGLYDVFSQDVPTTDEMEFVKMSDDQLFATFALSKDDQQRVKDVVADEAVRRGVKPPRCSSLVATFGFVWSCYQQAKESSGAGDDRMTCLLFPVDHRSRMTPPLPDKYFGNCVGPAFAMAPKGDLAAAGAGGLFSACAAVAAAIDEAVSGIGTPSMDVWVDRIREVIPLGVLTVAGSPKFRVYELDFGFGRPAKVDIVSVARTGAVAVADSPTSAGGIEVGVSLQPAGMDRYRKCFADGIAWLHYRN